MSLFSWASQGKAGCNFALHVFRVLPTSPSLGEEGVPRLLVQKRRPTSPQPGQVEPGPVPHTAGERTPYRSRNSVDPYAEGLGGRGPDSLGLPQMSHCGL